MQIRFVPDPDPGDKFKVDSDPQHCSWESQGQQRNHQKQSGPHTEHAVAAMTGGWRGEPRGEGQRASRYICRNKAGIPLKPWPSATGSDSPAISIAVRFSERSGLPGGGGGRANQSDLETNHLSTCLYGWWTVSRCWSSRRGRAGRYCST